MRFLLAALLVVWSVPVSASPDAAVLPPAAPTPAALPTGDAGEVRTTLQGWRGPAPSPVGVPLAAPVLLDRLSSAFGLRAASRLGTARLHQGIDVPGLTGTPVRAAADGVIAQARRAGSYGKLVSIDHGDGLETRYAHLSEIVVASGTVVRRGDVVGLMGSTGRSTGPHLHFEVRQDGQVADPLRHVGESRSSREIPRPEQRSRSGWNTTVVDRLPTATVD